MFLLLLPLNLLFPSSPPPPCSPPLQSLKQLSVSCFSLIRPQTLQLMSYSEKPFYKSRCCKAPPHPTFFCSNEKRTLFSPPPPLRPPNRRRNVMVFNWSRMPVWSAPSATTRLHDLQLRKVKRHCKHFCCGSSESRAGTQSRGVFPLRGRASLEPSRFSKQLHHHSSVFLFHFNDSKSQKTCIKYPLDPLDVFAPLAQPHNPPPRPSPSTQRPKWHLPFSLVGKLVFTLKLVPWPPSPHHCSSSRAKWV